MGAGVFDFDFLDIRIDRPGQKAFDFVLRIQFGDIGRTQIQRLFAGGRGLRLVGGGFGRLCRIGGHGEQQR